MLSFDAHQYGNPSVHLQPTHVSFVETYTGSHVNWTREVWRRSERRCGKLSQRHRILLYAIGKYQAHKAGYAGEPYVTVEELANELGLRFTDRA